MRCGCRTPRGGRHEISIAHLLCVTFKGSQPPGHRAACLDPESPYPTDEYVAWVPEDEFWPDADPEGIRHWLPPAPDLTKTKGVHVRVADGFAAELSYTINRRHHHTHPNRSSPSDLRSLGCVPGLERLESLIHRRFHHHRLRGKWFKLAGLREWLGNVELRARPLWGCTPFGAHVVSPADARVAGVYICQLGEDGPIKIGWSKSISRRIRDQSIANYEPLILRKVIAASPSLSERLKRAFHGSCIGEGWFRTSPDVLHTLQELPMHPRC